MEGHVVEGAEGEHDADVAWMVVSIIAVVVR